MSLPECVICQNRKPVNLTDNRLVTESCGHVKCMDCLVQEKSGCQACLRETNLSKTQEVLLDGPAEDGDKKKNGESVKKPKPETSHILVINDEIGKSFLCTLCKKRFHSRSQVLYHAYCNGQRKPYQCPECSKSFAAHSHYKYHMRVHRNERTYSCDDCGESFFQMSKLQRHRLKHTKEKKFACRDCNKAFSDLSALRKHSLLHTEVRPYSCPCGRAFRDASNFRRHRAKHDANQSGVKCLCAVCGRSVPSRRSLAAHARRHCASPTEGRAFSCPRCPSAFNSKKDLRRHSAVHTDSKPFRCKVCNRRFRRKDNLERHIRNTHPDYAPASAVECDEADLTTIQSPEEKKNQLQILNPLPPLPQEEIQKQLQTEGTEVELTELTTIQSIPSIYQSYILEENNARERQTEGTEVELTELTTIQSIPLIYQSYILEANNARESVIFGPVRKRDKSPENEYVHKIRKANLLASQKDIPLPPIDEKKIIELEKKSSSNNFDIGMPSNNMEVYKKILYERVDSKEKGAGNGTCNTNGPEMHWRRKMQLNINWKITVPKEGMPISERYLRRENQ